MLSIPAIRERTKSYRKSRGLTQDDLGRQLGITGAAISKFENNKSTLGAEAMRLLSQIVEAWDADSIRRTGTSLDPSITSAKCPGCGERTPITYEGRRLWHCGFCGHELGTLCTQCSTVNPPAARYCYDCGAAIQRRPTANYQAMAAESPAPYKAKPKK